jgi:iron complex transport system permease protein
LILLIFLSAPASLLVALLLGSVDIPLMQVLATLAGAGDALTHSILFELRLPRALAAFACGALLALAGSLLQALLRNPLADPYVLGVSGAAAVGALLGLLLGLGAALGGALSLLFALGGMALLALFAASTTGWNPYRVLLTGMALSSGCAALLAMILSLAPAAQLQGMLYWLMGDLSQAEAPWGVWLVLAAALLLTWPRAGALDALGLGEDKARSLGVEVGRLQSLLLLCCAAASVAAVMTGGAIGFIGLVVPHLLRLCGVYAHRQLLPLATLLGGSLLVLADCLARRIAAPIEIPVGVATALLGVPLLLWLLGRSR